MYFTSCRHLCIWFRETVRNPTACRQTHPSWSWRYCPGAVRYVIIRILQYCIPPAKRETLMHSIRFACRDDEPCYKCIIRQSVSSYFLKNEIRYYNIPTMANLLKTFSRRTFFWSKEYSIRESNLCNFSIVLKLTHPQIIFVLSCCVHST